MVDCLILAIGADTVQSAQDGMLSGMVAGGIGGTMNPSFCFVAGTAVLTVLGKKAIETIQVGDVIPCVDHITGEVAEKRVVSTTVNKVDRLTELNIDGGYAFLIGGVCLIVLGIVTAVIIIRKNKVDV